MTHNSTSHRYQRNLVIAFTSALLAGSLIVAVFVLVLVTRLAASTLDPQHTPIDQTPDGVTYTPVSFTTADDITLAGWYIPSTNGAAVVLIHGYGGNRTDLLPEAEILARAGYGVLMFDLRGHGESQSARVTFGHYEQRDLAAALDFVTAQPGVDPDRIGGLGFSMGGAALALAAANDERLRAVVIEAAFASLEDVIDDKAGLLGPLTQIPARWAIQREGVDIDGVRPVDALCNISPHPIFLIYGGADDTVPPGSQQRMFDAVCEPADTWLIPGAAHQNYTEVVPEEYAARLLDFFERSLPPLPTAPPFFIIAGCC